MPGTWELDQRLDWDAFRSPESYTRPRWISVSFLLVERLVHLARQSSNTFAPSEFLPDLAP